MSRDFLDQARFAMDNLRSDNERLHERLVAQISRADTWQSVATAAAVLLACTWFLLLVKWL